MIGRIFNRRFLSVLFICLLGLLFFTQKGLAAVPVQGRSLNGGGAAEARLRLISAAESFLGTPYRYAGLDKSGMDCSGLVYTSFREALNVLVPRTAETIYNWTEKITTNELQPGDLVFFITTAQKISHLGIYTGEGRFIHSASEGPQTGVIYSGLDESYWKRTYYGAGRALPWDTETAQAMAGVLAGNYEAGFSASNSGTSAKPSVAWAEPGMFAGFGAAWTWGGFIEGAPSILRGFSTLAALGYKWSKYRLGLELRPEWDRALGVFRLPITLSAGTDYFQVYGGPAISFGDPSLDLPDGERHYLGGGEWRWELGLSFSIPLVKIKSGALGVYGDLAWQPYHWVEGEKFSFKPDFTANSRFSTGLRYLWHL